MQILTAKHFTDEANSFVCYNGQLFCEDGSAPFEAGQRQDVTVAPKRVY